LPDADWAPWAIVLAGLTGGILGGVLLGAVTGLVARGLRPKDALEPSHPSRCVPHKPGFLVRE